jgi:hypothetical protein
LTALLAAQAPRDPRNGFASDVASVAERAVRLEHDTVLLAGIEQRLPILVRAEVHLVDDRCDRGGREQLLQLVATTGSRRRE